jgi:hypothetical protein
VPKASPLTFTKPKQELFLQQLRAGMRRGAASDVVFGEDANQRRFVRTYIAEHPTFEKKVWDAEVEATEHVEEALYQAAVTGHVAAAKAWIELQGRGRKAALPEAPPEAPERPTEVPGTPDYADLDNVQALDPRRRRES